MQHVEQRTRIEPRVHRHQQLFMHAPLPALVTDGPGTIIEANVAAGRLLRRDRLTRGGHAPVKLSASVRVIDGVGRTGGSGLHWMLRVLDTHG